jgi:AraC-like DNA-binding protein
MVDTKLADLDARLLSLSQELSRTVDALARSAAANAELCEATAKLCQAVHSSVEQSRHKLRAVARTSPMDNVPQDAPASSYTTGGLPTYKLRRVLDYIDSSLTERVEVATLAAIAGMSSGHFAAMFKQSTGLSPYQAVLQRRLARARDLLGEESLTIAEIGCSLGFSSQAHFTTAFRKSDGITPATFRIMQRRRFGLNHGWRSTKSWKAKSSPLNSESRTDRDTR